MKLWCALASTSLNSPDKEREKQGVTVLVRAHAALCELLNAKSITVYPRPDAGMRELFQEISRSAGESFRKWLSYQAENNHAPVLILHMRDNRVIARAQLSYHDIEVLLTDLAARDPLMAEAGDQVMILEPLTGG